MISYCIEDRLCRIRGGQLEMMASSSFGRARKTSGPTRSHKEAERRRRERINSHLSTLRSLLPSTTAATKKTDKASLLAGVVHHVRLLTQQLADATSRHPATVTATVGPTFCATWQLFPTDSDEATVSCYCADGLVKVTLCCDDRLGLIADVAREFRDFRARAVRAEMVSRAGRAKLMVLARWPDGEDGDGIGCLKQALEAVVDNQARGLRPGNKHAQVS